MKNKRKLNKLMPIVLVLTMTFCLIACGNTSSPAVGEDVVSTESTVPPSGVDATTETEIEKELPDSMDASEVADMLESGMTVDQVIDRVEEEIKDGKVPSADKPAEASPTQTPVSTPAPTAKPTPEPTATPEPTPTPEHVHEYTTESITRQATCAEAGEKKLMCECGNAKIENIPVVDHNWEPVYQTVTHPSTGHVEQVSVQVGTSTGRTEYECAVCGHREDSPDALSEHRASFVGVDRTHATARTVAYDYPEEPIYELQNQWVVDTPETTSQELVGYTCTVCGATK